jgi:hypothetical protein
LQKRVAPIKSFFTYIGVARKCKHIKTGDYVMYYDWYDEDEIYKTRPWWWDNLQLAHEANRRKLSMKKNLESQEFFDKFGLMKDLGA